MNLGLRVDANFIPYSHRMELVSKVSIYRFNCNLTVLIYVGTVILYGVASEIQYTWNWQKVWIFEVTGTKKC